ncbi:glycosyltransferase [Dietzia sp. KRD202]|uniref:glycosyltransferase n=1 Tax=Dietzia sp. KRD202 TaxID=2729732 RepID=UPI0019D2DDE1|nr:glycosyltransferase [Dietzia sp. KRD202]
MKVVVESRASGHRLVFVRLLIDHLHHQNEPFAFVTNGTVIDSVEFKDNLRSRLSDEELTVLSTPHIGPREVYRLAAQLDATQIIVPDGDGFARELLRFPRLWGRVPLVLLIIHDPRWERSELGWPSRHSVAKWLALSLLQSRLARRIRVKFLAAASGSSPSKHAVSDPVIIEDDFLTIRKAAEKNRRRLAMDESVTWIGVVGVISKYKNIAILIDAVERLNRRGTHRVGLALLGPVQPNYKAEVADLARRLSRSSISLVIDDEVRSNSQVNIDVASLDIVSVLYSVNCTNSTMAKAAALGVKTLAAGPPGFRKIYHETTGHAAQPLDVERVTDDLERLLIEPQPEPSLTPQPELFPIQLLRD